MNEKDIQNFFKIISSSQNILIINSKPDGDSIGASLALNKLISKLGKNPLSYSFSPIPEYLRFLVEKGEILFESEVNNDRFKETDLVIIVDASDVERSQYGKEVNWDSKTQFICIDHHQFQEELRTKTEEAYKGLGGDLAINSTSSKSETNSLQIQPSTIGVNTSIRFAFTDTSSESTCGIITEIFEEYRKISGNDLFDEAIAFLLFAGIVSDTDYFGYANVTKTTFERAATLMKYNFDIIPIIQQFRETLGLKAFYFIQQNIGKVVVNKDKRYAYLKIMRSDYREDDNLTVVNEAANFLNRAIIRIVDCVDFSFIIREINENKSSVAFRRHNNGNLIDLSKIASRFGGGGHTQAAGAVVEKSADKLEAELKEYIETLD